jgi:hypothetical protein
MKLVISLLLLFFGSWVGAAVAAQSQQEKDIVKSFNTAISTYIPTHVGARTKPYKVGCGWNMEYHEISTPYTIDVRKTDSLISPYVGTAEFGIILHIGKCHQSPEEAAKDSSYPTSYREGYRYTFAYQDEAWVIRSRQIRTEHGGWNPCGPIDCPDE